MNSMAATLVIFCKRPTLGQGKQRLAQAIGAEHALLIAEALLACAIEDANQWPGSVFIACSEHRDLIWAQSLMVNADIIAQLPVRLSGNLGQRLNFVDNKLRHMGHQQLVFIGTDAPLLTPEHYQATIASLNHHDMVFSHADDGGVTILANNVPWPLLDSLPWSSEKLSEAISQLCQAQQRNIDYILPSYDIDHRDDLLKLMVDLPTDRRPARQALLNIIYQLNLLTE